MKSLFLVVLLTTTCFAAKKREAAYDPVKNQTSVRFLDVAKVKGAMYSSIIYLCPGKTADCDAEGYGLVFDVNYLLSHTPPFLLSPLGPLDCVIQIDDHQYNLGKMIWNGHMDKDQPDMSTENVTAILSPAQFKSLLSAGTFEGQFGPYKFAATSKQLLQLKDAFRAPPKWEDHF